LQNGIYWALQHKVQVTVVLWNYGAPKHAATLINIIKTKPTGHQWTVRDIEET